MKPAPFDFARPSTLPEALELLSTHAEAKVLAGGQSLIPLLSMRLAAPAMLIDINGIPELSYIQADPAQPSQGVRIGALARHAEVEAHPGAREVQPLLGQALRLVAHPTIRNRGTTVGSLVHGDAAAETPAVLLLLGGRLTAASVSGRRDIEVADFYVGPLETAMRHDEIAVEAWFPGLEPDSGVAVEELARRHGDYALCGVAALARVVEGSVASVRAGYFSVCDVPTVVDLTPAIAGVVAAAVPRTAYADAAELALPHLDPGKDIHATAAYRAQLVRTLTERVVSRALADADGRSTELSEGLPTLNAS